MAKQASDHVYIQPKSSIQFLMSKFTTSVSASDPFDLPPAGSSKGGVIHGPDGAIETLLAAPKQPAWGGCIICHPHPLYGGAMSNKVVYTLASTAGKAGLVTLRFNFRGVGKSAGLHDDARGETDDVVWLAGQLRAALPANAPLLLAGFSFGAFVALKAAAAVKPVALMSVAPPFGKYLGDTGPRPPHPGCPWRVIHSRDDDTVAYADTAADLARYTPAPTLVTVDGAGHFFHGRLDEVDSAFAALIAEVTPAR